MSTTIVEERFPLKDGDGDPLGVGCFVAVERADSVIRGKLVKFRGLVTGIQQDGKGSYVVVAEWRGGAFSGSTRYARPWQCLTRRKPPGLRAEEAATAKRKIAMKEVRT
jgi:hypothetical protein